MFLRSSRPLRSAAVALALGSSFLAPLAPALAQESIPGTTPLTEAERDQFRAEVRAYLLDHPEVLMEAIQVLQDRQAQEQEAAQGDMITAHADAIFNDGYSWTGGNLDGDITLVEFTDYRCGYCRKAFEEVEELVKTDGKIRFVLKEFPILGDDSVAASRVAIATKLLAGDEAYKTLHDALMTYSGGYDDTSMTRLLNGLGLDADAILAARSDPRVAQEINANRTLAQTLQISGTPTFILPGTLLPGYVPLSGMRSIVAELRNK